MATNGVHELFELEYDIDKFQSDLLAPFGIYDDIPCEVVINPSKETEQEQKESQNSQEVTHAQNKPVKAKPKVKPKAKAKSEIRDKPKPLNVSEKGHLKVLKAEVDALIREQQAFEPLGDRKAANALSARLHRKRKELHVATLEVNNTALSAENEALRAENKQLKAALALREQQNGEFSTTVPATTMLIKYRSPPSSPMKPKVEAAQQSTFQSKLSL